MAYSCSSLRVGLVSSDVLVLVIEAMHSTRPTHDVLFHIPEFRTNIRDVLISLVSGSSVFFIPCVIFFTRVGNITSDICVLSRRRSGVTGLDIGPWQPLARGASESENPLAPQKTHWPPKNM